MKPRTILFLLACALLALLCACGVPGAPQPPSLKLPKPVADLRAARKGDKVTLTWTAPRVTTDQEGIKQPGATRVCRSLGTEPMSACAAVGEVSAAQAGPAKAVTFVDTLPAEVQQKNPEGFASYAVEALNSNRRSGGLSNQVSVVLAPTLPPPEQVAAEVTADGIVLHWSRVPVGPKIPNVHYVFQIYRQTKGAAAPKPLTTVSLEETSLLDKEFEWEKTYSYWMSVATVRKLRDTHEVRETPVPGGLTQVETAEGAEIVSVQGDDSTHVEVFVHDVFPPAVPAGVEAVYSPMPQQAGFIDLTWAPDTENDLAGYNVYRHEEGGAPVKINAELVKTPAFRDKDVAAGHKYFYSVSAVDLRGNESERSAETNESVPQ